MKTLSLSLSLQSSNEKMSKYISAINGPVIMAVSVQKFLKHFSVEFLRTATDPLAHKQLSTRRSEVNKKKATANEGR